MDAPGPGVLVGRPQQLLPGELQLPPESGNPSRLFPDLGRHSLQHGEEGAGTGNHWDDWIQQELVQVRVGEHSQAGHQGGQL